MENRRLIPMEYRQLKTKDIIKRALKNPELFTEAELLYFRKIDKERKDKKLAKSDYLK